MPHRYPEEIRRQVIELARSGTLANTICTKVRKTFGLEMTCLYGSDGLESLVDADAGKHKLATSEAGLAEILVSETLSFIKGSNFCPEAGTWTANYVVYTLETGEKRPKAGWLYMRVYRPSFGQESLTQTARRGRTTPSRLAIPVGQP